MVRTASAMAGRELALLLERHRGDVHAIESGERRRRRGRGQEPFEPVGLAREGLEVCGPVSVAGSGRVEVPARVPGHRLARRVCLEGGPGDEPSPADMPAVSWPESRAV